MYASLIQETPFDCSQVANGKERLRVNYIAAVTSAVAVDEPVNHAAIPTTFSLLRESNSVQVPVLNLSLSDYGNEGK